MSNAQLAAIAIAAWVVASVVVGLLVARAIRKFGHGTRGGGEQ